ncbi:hypothetical protein WJX82_008191 [Trebouxia sp. C0006]
MDYQPVLVMGVGLLLGSVIRGVTGFGSSIALLSIWVISRAVGIRTSTFQQLVLTDSLSALVASPPLLYVTNARRFTDWRLVFTAVTFQVVGSPIELPLNSAHSNWSLQNSNYGGSRRGSMTAASFNPASLQSRLESGVSILARHNARLAPPVVRVSQASVDLVKQDVQSYHSSSPAMSWMRRLQPDPSTVVINYPVEYSWEDVESGQSPLPSPVPTPVPTRPPSPSPHADTTSEACRQERMMVAVTTDPDECPIPADADGSHDGVSAVMAEYKLAEHEKNRAWKILGAGSVAGTLSGLMGTLAGQPGPPLILMFALLKVPKEVVRATNAVNCCISPRLATYFIVGAFVKSDWPLYAVGQPIASLDLPQGLMQALQDQGILVAVFDQLDDSVELRSTNRHFRSTFILDRSAFKLVQEDLLYIEPFKMWHVARVASQLAPRRVGP